MLLFLFFLYIELDNLVCYFSRFLFFQFLFQSNSTFKMIQNVYKKIVTLIINQTYSQYLHILTVIICCRWMGLTLLFIFIDFHWCFKCENTSNLKACKNVQKCNNTNEVKLYTSFQFPSLQISLIIAVFKH
jgi:hypothetical protein